MLLFEQPPGEGKDGHDDKGPPVQDCVEKTCTENTPLALRDTSALPEEVLVHTPLLPTPATATEGGEKDWPEQPASEYTPLIASKEDNST